MIEAFNATATVLRTWGTCCEESGHWFASKGDEDSALLMHTLASAIREVAEHFHNQADELGALVYASRMAEADMSQVANREAS